MLHVHRAERADGLVAALRELLLVPPDDPFAPEVVCVPTRGMERWLTQRMSDRLGAAPGRRDGICANVRFPSPRALVGDAVAAACGIAPDEDRWPPERAVWPLLDVVDAGVHEPWLAVLADHLGQATDELRRARRFSTVRHLAELFDRYALHRPDMVRGWAAGADDGWQAELWRRLRARIGQPGIAERLAEAGERLRADAALADLPPRLSLFGLTRLPAGHLAVLRALAHARDVHLFLLHPSPVLWNRVAAELGSGEPVVLRRADGDRTARLPRNRLLASWGQDAREMQLVLDAETRDGAIIAHHHPVEHRGATLLERLQADVREDRAPPGEPLPDRPEARPLLDPADRTVQVHACHGRARQVEVVRDAILHELERDPGLEPRDVIVMCPDIETFAPLIHATFGAGDVHDAADEDLATVPPEHRPPDLRVRLADRSLRQTNPVLGVVAQLVEVAGGRLTASQVLDLADREPVRRRFGLDDDDLSRIEDWVAASGIRWGLDAAHRAPYRLDRLEAGTWRAGLDRVLLGVAMTEDDQRLVGGVLPLDDVESGAIDLAGRLAELVDRLRLALDALEGPKTIDRWADAIAEAADALTATSRRDAWQRAELQRILDAVVAEARVGGALADAALTLPEVRALLAERLQGRPTRANFRTGHLTICTLVPMRSVPHRVVCLLGLDDAVFPRKAPRDGDDLMLDEPHVGDRDARSEDRQQLLDALLAARDRLIVTYTGNDERTNVVRPPAVPVGELLDAVDRTVRTDTGEPARTRIVIRHPLQPFDPRNFTPGRLAGDAPWSFDRVTLDGARALRGPRTEPKRFLAGPLAARRDRIVLLDGLVRFVERPARAFLRQRLGISLGEASDEVDDALPIELGGLEKWQVADRLLGAHMAGADLDRAVAAEVARGALPPGELAVPVLDEIRPKVEELARLAEAELGGRARPGSVDVRLRLPDGRTLSGTVPGVCGDVLVRVTYSRVSPRLRLAAWVRWLALTAAHPERAFEALTIGRVRAGVPRADVTLARIAVAPGAGPAERAASALDRLAVVLELYDRGMREPLPLFCLTSAAYAETVAKGGDGAKAAEGAWTSAYNFPREDADAEHQLVLGGVPTLGDLLTEAPRADECGPGWFDDEPTRFGRYARRLWAGLLDIEDVSDR